MAVLFTLLLGTAVILLGTYMYQFGKQNFLRETEAAIDNEIAYIASLASTQPIKKTKETIEQRFALVEHPIYQYRTIKGQIIAGNIDKVPPHLRPMKEGVLNFTLNRNNKSEEFAAKIHTFSDGSSLMIARNIDDILNSYSRLQWLFAWVILFLVIVIAVSFFISQFVVKRINLINNTARNIITTGDVSQRIAINTGWDDLSYLAETLNGLLAKIEQLMQDLRDVSDNIAHDLRTPLTRLRNQLEHAQNRKLTRECKGKLLSEADELLETFAALLRISNIAKGKRHHPFQTLSLSNLLSDVIELYEPVAEEKMIIINHAIASNINFTGDKNLLFQLFANLIDNAIKFSPEKSLVTVTANQTHTGTQVVVSDKGVGINPQEHDKIFNRFYRSDKSRTSKGNGLGLSLVKAVADMHHAKISVIDNRPGLSIIIHFVS